MIQKSQKRRAFWRQRLLQNLRNTQRLAAIAVSYHIAQYYIKTPRLSSIIHGGDRIHEMLYINHPDRVLHALRMTKPTFLKLKEFCEEHTALRNGRLPGKGVSIEEKLAMFLYNVSNGVSNRRSGHTVSRCFHQVLDALLILHKQVVKLPGATQPLDPRIADDEKYFPYFQDCIGALDGTHVDAFIQSEAQPPYRNRKGDLTQNVLGVCTFDLQFSFVYAGWEGSAHDTRVLDDAFLRGEFSVSPGKYYLGDAGYPNKAPCLTPYRGVRYHLREQALASQRPSNSKELFIFVTQVFATRLSAYSVFSNAVFSVLLANPKSSPFRLKLSLSTPLRHFTILSEFTRSSIPLSRRSEL